LRPAPPSVPTLSQKPGFSGVGGISVTSFLAVWNATTWLPRVSCAVTISLPARPCSTASGPAPRWAAPAALPCQALSIFVVSPVIEVLRCS
jgi:hypothetical protein